MKILDFGIARAEERLGDVRAGAVKGALAYMAPEQSRTLAVDRRADVWSLGVVAASVAAASHRGRGARGPGAPPRRHSVSHSFCTRNERSFEGLALRTAR